MSHKVKSNGTIKQLPEVGEALGWKEWTYAKTYTTKAWANADNNDDLIWTVPENGLYYIKFTFKNIGDSTLGTFDDRALTYRQFSIIHRRNGTDGTLAINGVNTPSSSSASEFSQEIITIYPLKKGEILYPQIWTDTAGKKCKVLFFAAKISH